MTADAAAPASRDDWDAHWGDYASTAEDNPAQRFRRDGRLRAARRRDGAPQRLFDIGAGQGDLLADAPHARGRRRALAGVELSATGVAEAVRKVPDARVVQGNLLLDVGDPPSDLRRWATHAVCSEVLEHVDDPGAAAAQRTGASSAPGCRVVVTVPGGPRSAFDKHIGHRRHFDRAVARGAC